MSAGLFLEQGLKCSQSEMLACAPNPAMADRRSKPYLQKLLKCPRCDSLDTKFCYYNNYSLTQPRYFCKNCKRYWTDGGALRNVPVGGGLRKNKRSKHKEGASAAVAPSPPAAFSDSPLSSEKSPNNNNCSPQSSLALQEDEGSFRFPNCPVEGAHFRFDSVRKRAGEKRSIHEAAGWEFTPHLSYGEVRNVQAQVPFFAGYSYSVQAAVDEAGLPPHYEDGFGGYNLLGPARFSASSQAQSSTASTSVPVEELATGSSTTNIHYDTAVEPGCRNHAVLESLSPLQHVSRTAEQQQFRHVHEEEEEEEAIGTLGTLSLGKLRPQTGRLMNSTEGTQEHPTPDDVSTGAVINPYDWQLISEGLFGGPASDYFYAPGAGWPE